MTKHFSIDTNLRSGDHVRVEGVIIRPDKSGRSKFLIDIQGETISLPSDRIHLARRQFISGDHVMWEYAEGFNYGSVIYATFDTAWVKESVTGAEHLISNTELKLVKGDDVSASSTASAKA
ncbi:hypothetical protein [Roseibium sp.]|uniref:hypothetical protein n=1 Tax=Roseibium sp. TaxID=1936156 RepID=UPI003BAB84DE